MSCLNDLKNYERHFNVDIMMLYISAMDHVRKLKFSSYVSISLCFSDSIHCRRGYYF